MHGIPLRAALAASATIVGINLAAAAPTTYTDRAAFDAALAGFAVEVVDFESTTAPSPVPDGTRFGNVTLSFDRGIDSTGLDMLVTERFVATSGQNYLGVDDGFREQFLNDDGLSLSFATPAHAIGLYVITPGDGAFYGDFTLIAAGTSVSNPLAPDLRLDTGDPALPLDDAYFLGIFDPDASFASATLSSLDPALGFVSFNIDDIVLATDAGGDDPGATLPLPGTLVLVALGLGLLSRPRSANRAFASATTTAKPPPPGCAGSRSAHPLRRSPLRPCADRAIDSPGSAGAR